MKYTINDQVVLSKPLDGPLAAYIEPFSILVSNQEYAPYTLYRRILLAACFSRWLDQEGIRLHTISSVHPVQYLHFREQQQGIASGDAAALKQLIDFLRDLGAVPIEKSEQLRLTPVDKCVQAFEQYLREERGLSNATVINYVPFIRDFLNSRFRNRAKLMTSALRSFLKYALLPPSGHFILTPSAT